MKSFQRGGKLGFENCTAGGVGEGRPERPRVLAAGPALLVRRLKRVAGEEVQQAADILPHLAGSQYTDASQYTISRRLVLGCMDSYDSEERRILSENVARSYELRL